MVKKNDWVIFKSGFSTERKAKNAQKRSGKKGLKIKSRKRSDGSKTWSIFAQNKMFKR